MGKKGRRIRKSIQVYLSKLKKVPTSLHLPSSSSSSSPRPPAATSWLMSACKYPRTPSFAVHRDRKPGDGAAADADHVDDTHAATLSDVDRFLYENFHTLYSHGRCGDDDDDDAGDFSEDSPCYDSDPPGAEEIRSTGRFFASPGTSNSLLEDTRPSDESSSLPSSSSPSSLSNSAVEPERAGGDGVAVMTFSKDPYDDFLRSMQDMVDSRKADPDQPLDWDFMEELLFCYLELNDRSVHKYILRAFTDLVVSCRRQVPASRRKIPATDGADKASRRSAPKGRGGDAPGAPRHLPATDRRREAQRLVGSR